MAFKLKSGNNPTMKGGSLSSGSSNGSSLKYGTTNENSPMTYRPEGVTDEEWADMPPEMKAKYESASGAYRAYNPHALWDDKYGVEAGKTALEEWRKTREAEAAAEEEEAAAEEETATADSRWSEGSDKAKAATGKSLNELVKIRGGLEKGSPEYNAIQNEINKALGSDVRHDQKKREVIKDEESGEKMIIRSGEGDNTRIKTKTDEDVQTIVTEGGESEVTQDRSRLGHGRIKEGIAKFKAKRAAKKANKKKK
jgi:hypothetical protein